MTRNPDVLITVGPDGPGGRAQRQGHVAARRQWLVSHAGIRHPDRHDLFRRDPDLKDKYPKKNPKGTVTGFHYMLTARTRLAPVTFKGYLDDMARDAVAVQVRAAQATTTKK